MSTQTSPEQRHEFYALHQHGESYRVLAEMSGVSLECVRYWCRRQRDGGGCCSQYVGRRPAGLLQQFDSLVRYWVLRFKLEHPRWGPGRIRAHLKKRLAWRCKKLPSTASIGQYLHQWSSFHRRSKQKPQRIRPDQPTAVHQRWQIDFKVAISLQNGQQVDLHTVRDPVGEACLGAILYPTEKATLLTKRVPMEAVRATLRTCFQHWKTLPDEIQTDGETCLSPAREDSFPSLFTLWLTGLGIRHLVIRPGKPTDNAEVERCHRTINDYAIVGNENCGWTHLQDLLNQAVSELNYELPSRAEGCAGKTPIQAHPELLQPHHPFLAENELAAFDLQRVDAYLAGLTWQRKVGKTGQICLGGSHHPYSVGRRYAQHEILVRFDPNDRYFVFFDSQSPEQEIGRRPARGLEVEDITGLATSPDGLLPQQLSLPLFGKGNFLMSK
jgi:transposase InsO family protein